MTLQQQLHEQAELAQLPPVDLDAVTRAGSRTVRRRRWVAGAAALATVVVVGGVAVAVRPEPRQPEPADPTPAPSVLETTALTWASGEVLHTPSGDVPVGHEITAFARSEAGYVVASRNEVYSVVDGETFLAQVVGDDPRVVPTLYGDTDGSLVAWRSPGAYEVLDLADGSLLSVPTAGPGAVIGVDGRTLYVLEATQARAIDVDTGAPTDLPGHPAAYEDGVPLELGAVGPRDARRVLLSPTARWAALDAGREAQVYDVASGEQVPMPVAGVDSMVVEWLDDDSFSVVTLPSPDADYELLKCHVPIQRCEVETAPLRPAFTLPTGQPFLFLPRP